MEEVEQAEIPATDHDVNAASRSEVQDATEVQPEASHDQNPDEPDSSPLETASEVIEADQAEGDESTDEPVVIATAVQDSPAPDGSAALKAVIEAAIYITDEPLSAEQIANAVEQPLERVKEILN